MFIPFTGSTMINAIAGGAGIGNSTNLTDTEKNYLTQVAEQKLGQSQIENSVSSIIAKGMSNAIVNNSNTLKAMLKQENTISLGQTPDIIRALQEGLTPEGKAEVAKVIAGCQASIDLSNISQVNQAEVNAAAEAKSTVVTDMANAMKSEVSKEMESMQSSMKNENLGSTFQGVADAVGKTFANLGDNMEAVADGSLGGAGIGNSYNQKKVRESHKEMKNLFNIENLQEVKEEDMKDMSLTNELSNENVNQIIGEVLQANGIKANALCPANITASDIEQLNVADMKIESKTLSEISNKVANNAHTNIDKFLGNLQMQATKTVQGDIQQLGTATAAALVAGGEAVATASEGIGTGLSNFLGGNIVKYAMIGFAVIALIAGIVFIARPDAASSTIKAGLGGPDDMGPGMGPGGPGGPGMGPDGPGDFGPGDFGPGGPGDFGPGGPGMDMGPPPNYQMKHLSHFLN